MEHIVKKQTHVVHVRRRTFSLFTICIVDSEKIVTTPQRVEMRPTPLSHMEKMQNGRVSYLIDLKV
jgi:hypothetical protein